MTKKLQSIFNLTLVLSLTSILMFNNAFSQQKTKNQMIFDDDPNLDQIPEWYLNQASKVTKAPSTVITIDDYDNFYLGVDFAECHISANPLDPTQFFTAYNTDYTHRTQDGHDWNNATAVSWGTTIRGDVLTAYDGAGNLYYENMYGSSILGCKIVRSSNNGLTWTSPVTAISGNDKNWLAADQTSGPYGNYVYTVMTNSGSGNFARSTNQGASWTTTFTPSTQSLPGMMVCVGPNGTIDGGSVYVVTNSGSSFASTYTFYRSTNGGATFSSMSAQNFAGYVGTNVNGRNSVENMRTRPYPFIAADNSNGSYRGRLYLVYASNWPAGDGNKPDIWCRYSNNGGSTWSSEVKINDDANTQNNHQWAPAIWCDVNTGRLYVHWMDTRDDITGDDEAYMYASYSDNGGVSFAPNQKLSNEPMIINCSTCGGGGTPRYQGDYTSIVSNENVSMSSWTDFRDGSFASFTGYFPDYAMRLTVSDNSNKGVNTVLAEVPSVKLYTDDVIFTGTMQTPPSGNFTITYPSGNTLSSFPGSIPIQITDNGVPSGMYTLTVVGKGPNGTPVHERQISISVVELAAPVANFMASTTNPFVNTQVNFTDLSTNAPTSWAWSFNPSTINYLNGTNAGSQNPQVEFLAPGTYSVTLIATNAYGSDTETKVNYINVTNCSYCSAGGSNATEEWISNVTFNTINNSVNTTAGYEDFTYLSTDVMPGSTYNASVSCSSIGSWSEYYWIFIDWNQDCDLSGPGEAYNLGFATGTNSLNQNITIPVSATPGATRMRVIIKYSSSPTSCETFSFGQVEDYTINVMATDINVGLTALLEGPFNGVNMDADLGSLIPLNQPFNMAPWNYSGTESVGSVPANVVDWVLVDLRDAATAASAIPATSIGKQAAFILSNGSIVGLDGSSDLTFSVTVSQNLYAAVWQRNHIGIMSNNAIAPSGSQYNYNFTTGVNQVYGGSNGHKQLVSGKWGMFSGDGNPDGMVNNSDKSTLWENQAGTNGYIPSDYNLDSESNNIDKDNYWVPNIGEGSQVPN
ncbi:MAG: PKD domain-containing protein [Bacteroidales bacterium]|nr:PKD domain-containing protein [Bacteroidales bacterium]MCF8402719.1 PKD domain-containing protein [Bacteroidales bacterium]